MTNLTEKWKKGELPDGEEYWVILTDEWYLRTPVKPVRAFYSCECEFEGYLDDDIKEVLAPVPSYEEWKASEKYNKHLEEVIKVYERKDKQATETSIAYNKLAEENEELKLLVVEALPHFKASLPFLYRDWIDKADKFLGEDKCGKRK